MDPKIQLHAVIFKSGDWWIGQCLEHDIGAEAKSIKDIPYELERAIVAHIVIAESSGIEPFKTAAPAPSRYWKMFTDGLPVKDVEERSFVVMGQSRRAPAPEARVFSDLISEPA